MKSGTESKLKFKQLKRRLQLRYWQVVGVLETLWRVAQTDAPAGDIGRLDNDEIAAAMEWEGPPEALIDALIDTHWLDRDEEFRLIIHDWSEHAPNHLVGAFKRHGRLFADQIVKNRAKQVANHDAKQVARDHAIAPCPGTMPPNQTKPNQTKPTNQPGADSELAGGGDLDSWENEDVAARARLILKACDYNRIGELIAQCEEAGTPPSEVILVCREFQANRAKLDSPGAIASRMRTGVWPANGVARTEQIQRSAAKSDEAKMKQAVETCRMKLIKAGCNDARDWDADAIIAKSKEMNL